MPFDRLTPLENKSRDTILIVMEWLASGRKANRMEFMTLMTVMRDTLRALENKSFGCPTGAHSSVCDCTPPKLGHAKYKHYGH